jgi:hypothetical protein
MKDIGSAAITYGEDVVPFALDPIPAEDTVRSSWDEDGNDMSEHISQAIADLEEKLRPIEEQAKGLRQAINQLCKVSGLPERYTTDDESAPLAIRSDEFYGQPLSTAVRKYLELRKATGQSAATVAQIYDALAAGGYKFESKNDGYAKRGLRQSLTKNSGIFHKLPNGEYGLLSWYPEAQARRRRKGGGADQDDADNGVDEAPDDGAEEPTEDGGESS